MFGELFSTNDGRKNDGVHLSNYGGYHSKTDIWEKESKAPPHYQACLNVVRDYAYNAIAFYLQNSMYPIKAQYPKNKRDEIAWQADITNAWINVNGQYHFNVPHIHPITVISGVYYIDHGGDECTTLYFDNPMQAPVHDFTYLGTDGQKNIDKAHMNDNHLAIHSIPGTYLIFPSWLQHYTLPHHCVNTTNETSPVEPPTIPPMNTDAHYSDIPSSPISKTNCHRMSIAFNVYIEKKYLG